MSYNSFLLDIKDHIATVSINKPQMANALHTRDWLEMKSVFEELDKNDEVRAIILHGEGKHFCAGMELATFMELQQEVNQECEGRKREDMKAYILMIQDCISAIEKCKVPVIANIHNGCIGGGLDLVSACDFRYCTADAWFTIKEVDLGMVADLGTLQRLPKIIHPGIMAELAYTGRKVFADEAVKIGLVNQSFESKESMLNHANSIARQISEKSPLTIRGIKDVLLYQRDHSVSDGLKYVSIYNAGTLLSSDLQEAMSAYFEKRTPEFKN